MPIVFQYGSNTSVRRLNSATRLNGAAAVIGVARTVDSFDLEFTVSSRVNNCAAANIAAGGGRQIWGVLFEIPALEALDAIEGVNTGNYRRQLLRVTRPPSTDPLDVITYVAASPTQGIRTEQHYVDHILSGLGEYPGVPAEYLDYVRAQIRLNNPTLRV